MPIEVADFLTNPSEYKLLRETSKDITDNSLESLEEITPLPETFSTESTLESCSTMAISSMPNEPLANTSSTLEEVPSHLRIAMQFDCMIKRIPDVDNVDPA